MKATKYELLGMIKDGKAPKKIRYRYSYLYKDFKFDGETLNYISDKDFLFGEDITAILNDEVEIIDEIEEEKKIPEKIPEEIIVGKKHPTHRIKKIEKKINEILDYLKSKGDE